MSVKNLVKYFDVFSPNKKSRDNGMKRSKSLANISNVGKQKDEQKTSTLRKQIISSKNNILSRFKSVQFDVSQDDLTQVVAENEEQKEEMEEKAWLNDGHRYEFILSSSDEESGESELEGTTESFINIKEDTDVLVLPTNKLPNPENYQNSVNFPPIPPKPKLIRTEAASFKNREADENVHTSLLAIRRKYKIEVPDEPAPPTSIKPSPELLPLRRTYKVEVPMERRSNKVEILDETSLNQTTELPVIRRRNVVPDEPPPLPPRPNKVSSLKFSTDLQGSNKRTPQPMPRSATFKFEVPDVPPPLPPCRPKSIDSMLSEDSVGSTIEDLEMSRSSYENLLSETRRSNLSKLHQNVLDSLEIEGNENMEFLLFKPVEEDKQPRSSNLIDELRDTERSYILKLKKFLKEYMTEIESIFSNDLTGDPLCIGISNIYKKSSYFLGALHLCMDAEDVANTFVEYEALFQLYPSFIGQLESLPAYLKSYEKLLKRNDKFVEIQELKAILISPLQRLSHYRLFLQKLQEQNKGEKMLTILPNAISILEEQLDESSKYVSLKSLVDPPKAFLENGKCLIINTFQMTSPITEEVNVFLFEQSIVIATLTLQRSDEQFDYFEGIKMKDLRFKKSDLPNVLILEDKRKKASYHLNTKTEENFQAWVFALNKYKATIFEKTAKVIRKLSTRRAKEKPAISSPYNFEVMETENKDVVPIKDCPLDLKDFGPFVTMGVFTVKMAKVTVYLFGKMIVFATVPKAGAEYCSYKYSVALEDLSLEPENVKHPRKLRLKDYKSSKKFSRDIVYELKADTKETQVAWRKEIEGCLWQQFQEAKDSGT